MLQSLSFLGAQCHLTAKCVLSTHLTKYQNRRMKCFSQVSELSSPSICGLSVCTWCWPSTSAQPATTTAPTFLAVSALLWQTGLLVAALQFETLFQSCVTHTPILLIFPPWRK